jgi:Icc-related predicted phosphoesterase
MKILIASDLHLEFIKFDHERYIDMVLGSDKNGCLVLAGDISTVPSLEFVLRIICSKFKHVLYVPGNHEYYGCSIDLVNKLLSGLDIANLHVLNRKSVEIESINFIGCTLWSDFDNNNPLSKMDCQAGVNDFSVIKHFTTDDAVLIHRFHRLFIDSELRKNSRSVVITHHAPSYQSIKPQYRHERTNGAFASSLDELIYEYQPLLWIHGHTHTTFDYSMDRTRVICNPYGYPDYTNTHYSKLELIV